jgi:uncharacterized protein
MLLMTDALPEIPSCAFRIYPDYQKFFDINSPGKIYWRPGSAAITRLTALNGNRDRMSYLPVSIFNGFPAHSRMAISLAVATLGGWVAALAGLPLPWLLGSMAVSSILALCGAELGIADWIRKTGQAMAGFSVGLYFTPQVAQRVVELGGLMVVTSLLSILASLLLSILLSKLGRCGKDTAYFATLPGGLAEMAGLAGQFGANVTLVSLAQALRVVIIVLTLPPLLTFSLGASSGESQSHLSLSLWLSITGLIAAFAASLTLQRLRIFNSWLLGGLLVGVTFGLGMAEHAYAPSIIPSAAQIGIGAALGARFKPALVRAAGFRFLPATIATTLLLIGFNALLAFLLADHIGLGTGILATAPGGIAEMSLTAEMLRLSPPIVTAWQLVRIILVALLSGHLFRIYQRYL